jgi:hypothetical protein
MDIQLNFINQSNDTNNSQIVIFQKNVATDYDELAVAWRVIQNVGQGDNYPFVFPVTTSVSVSDSYGNHTPQLAASPGQLFRTVLTPSGELLEAAGAGSSNSEIQVLHAWTLGAVNANIYKGGKLLATRTIGPRQTAVFEFMPLIWIGVASQVVEGQVMNSAIISSVKTELSLLGIASADIAMTGGGPGKDATPFQFTLQNVVRT